MARTVNLHNPVLRGMYPDPSWLWDEERGDIVLINSSFELVPGLPIHSSSDFTHWRQIANAIDEDMARRLLMPFVEDSGGLYAPTIRRIRGRYVIACTVARLNMRAARCAGVDERTIDAISASQGNFIITAERPEGPWDGPFWVRGAEGIDPDLLQESDGTVMWTQTRPAVNPQWDGQTEIWTQRIDPETWSLIGTRDARGPFGKTVIWRGYGVDAIWAEGPHLYSIGDYVYLMTAEGGTGFDHSAMLMRAEATHGLWRRVEEWLDKMGEPDALESLVRRDERSVVGVRKRLFHPDARNPFLTHRHLGSRERVQCVGHADLLHHPTAGWWAACLGVRETFGHDSAEPLNYMGRETFVMPLAWRRDPASVDTTAGGNPGWPELAGGEGRIPRHVIVKSDGQGLIVGAPTAARSRDMPPQARWECIDDDDMRLVGVHVDPSVRYVRVDDDAYTSLTSSGSTMRLRRDSANHVSVRLLPAQVDDAGRVLECVVTRRGVSHITRAQVSAGFELLGLTLCRGRIECFSCPRTVLDGTVMGRRTLLAVLRGEWHAPAVSIGMDAGFLSTERAGGFVGCLVGV